MIEIRDSVSVVNRLPIRLMMSAMAFLFVSLAFGPDARAATNCPPGMEPVKLGSVATCSPPSSARTSSGIDPKAAEVMRGDGDTTKNNPKFKSLKQGEWSFPRLNAEEQRKHNLPKGDFCRAVFMTVDGAVVLGGPGGKYRGAMLSFIGPNLPKPKKHGKQKITLTQSPDPAATFQAFSYTDDRIGMGVIDVVVPTIEAALDSMVEKQPFKLEIDSRVVMEITWNNGLAARDRLRNCVNGK